MQTLILNGTVPKSRRDVFLSASIASGIENETERQNFLSATCVGDRVKNEALHLTKMIPPETVNSESLKHWAYSLPRDLSIKDWVILQQGNDNSVEANRVLRKAEQVGVAEKAESDILAGEDVLALFPEQRPGRWVGANISAARNAQYAGKFTNRSEALSWLQANKIFV